MLTKSKAADISVLNIRYPDGPLKPQQHPMGLHLETKVEEKLESGAEDEAKQGLEPVNNLGKHVDRRQVAVKNHRNVNHRHERNLFSTLATFIPMPSPS
jgi:hypothetical protein